MVKPLERLGERERDVIDERRQRGYGTGTLTGLGDHEHVLRTLVDLLLPGVPAAIDLAAFVDANTGRPLGRGDRPAGTPAEPELFRDGLQAVVQSGFLALPPDAQRSMIGRMRRGETDDELGMPAKLFIDRLLDKALTGYLAHPDTWVRIGFHGPAYPQGYAWIGPTEAAARHDQKRGWESL
jgi:hypothetical protein